MSARDKLLFAGTFILLLAGRLAIAGTGYLEDTDELLYAWIHIHFSQFGHADIWVKCITDVQGQLPEMVIRLVEYITVLPIATFMGKSMLHPDVLCFIGLYNILISLVILYVFFRILLKLHFTFEIALSGVVLLGTLFNYNMYTRHILPYDNALLFQLLAFNLLLKDDLKPRHILLAGLLSAIGLTNYMGSFMFIFINAGYVVIAHYKNPKAALIKILFFVVPFVMLVAVYEVFTRINGQSYLRFLTHYYGTVNNGASFDEGLSFVFLYFYLVEKWWGVALLLLFFTGAYMLFKRSYSAKIKLVLSLGFIAYISYGTYVYAFQKMVFEGRVFHIYYPFIIIGVLCFVQQQSFLKKSYIIPAIVLFAFINYAFVIRDFNSIGYPRNAIYKYGLFEQKGRVNLTYYEEMLSPMHYSDRAAWYIDSTGPTVLLNGNYALCNICFLVDVPDTMFKYYSRWQKTDKDSIVFEQLHFQSHPAYTLEYNTRFGRNFYLQKKFKIRVVKTQ